MSEAINQMPEMLENSTLNPKQKHLNRIAAFDALSPLLETSLLDEIEKLQYRHDSPIEDSSPDYSFWREKLIEKLQPVVELILDSTNSGSPLLRREARQKAVDAIKETVREIELMKRKTDKKIGCSEEKDINFLSR